MPRKHNITGKKYGSLTVLREVDTVNYSYCTVKILECQCDCGNIVRKRRSNITGKPNPSCGCAKKGSRLDLVGAVFGELTVIEEIGSDAIHGAGVLWKCLCSCGNTVEVPTGRLRSGITKSCGCFRIRQTPAGIAGLRRAYTGYRASAKTRGLSFELSLEQFKALIESDCDYCGIPPNRDWKPSNTPMPEYTKFRGNGVDRVDSSLGYTSENTVPCCTKCNRAKLDFSKEEFLEWAERLAKHQGMVSAT